MVNFNIDVTKPTIAEQQLFDASARRAYYMEQKAEQHKIDAAATTRDACFDEVMKETVKERAQYLSNDGHAKGKRLAATVGLKSKLSYEEAYSQVTNMAAAKAARYTR